VPQPQVFKALAELFESWVVCAVAQAPGDLDLDLLRLLVRVRCAKHSFEQVGVEHQGLQVVPDRVDVDVLVDEIDRLRPEDVPEELARPGRGLDRLVDPGKPAVVGLVSTQDRVG